MSVISQSDGLSLVIAHRPETIAGAQRVVVVKDGQVVELMHAVESAREPPEIDGATGRPALA